jgi:hypothetical protein
MTTKEFQRRIDERAELPYGVFHDATHEVLFNRDYKPLLERKPGMPTVAVNAERGDEGYRFGCDAPGVIEYFYDDNTTPFRRRTAKQQAQVATLRAILEGFRRGAFGEALLRECVS